MKSLVTLLMASSCLAYDATIAWNPVTMLEDGHPASNITYLVNDTFPTDDNCITLTNLDYDVEYYVTVQAVSGTNLSKHSSILYFKKDFDPHFIITIDEGRTYVEFDAFKPKGINKTVSLLQCADLIENEWTVIGTYELKGNHIVKEVFVDQTLFFRLEYD